MQEFADELMHARNVAGEIGDALRAKYKLAHDDAPLDALGSCFNYITSAAELTSHYDAAWNSLAARAKASKLNAEQIAIARKENGQCLVITSKTAFVWCMSSMEHSAKRAVAKYPKALQMKKSKPFLADIIAVCDGNLVPALKRPLWFGAITIRNKMVHNNGVGDEARTWVFSRDLTIVMEDQEMMTGTIMTFPRLTSWLVTEYADWCDRFLAKALS